MSKYGPPRVLTEAERKDIARRQTYVGRYIVRMRPRTEEADVYEWHEGDCAYGWLMDFDSPYEADRWVREKEEREACEAEVDAEIAAA